jgi:protein gp37
MAGLSEIEWTDATWNPVAGCSMVSPGCTNCYAMRMAARLQAMHHVAYLNTTRKSGSRYIWTGQVNLIEAAMTVPLQWKKPRRIFVNSMSDLFQDELPEHFIAAVWRTMEVAHWHTFQILTKRPGRMARVLRKLKPKALPNVWLGTSVESAKFVGRIDALRATPAAIRFVSFEPLLASIGDPILHGIDWAIVGGESGPRARPMDEAWVAEIKDACTRYGTAFFFKQWGGKNKKATGRLLRGRTWDEYPACGEARV